MQVGAHVGLGDGVIGAGGKHVLVGGEGRGDGHDAKGETLRTAERDECKHGIDSGFFSMKLVVHQDEIGRIAGDDLSGLIGIDETEDLKAGDAQGVARLVQEIVKEIDAHGATNRGGEGPGGRGAGRRRRAGSRLASDAVAWTRVPDGPSEARGEPGSQPPARSDLCAVRW